MVSYSEYKCCRLINIKNCSRIVIHFNYIRKISDINYEFKTGDMTKLKSEDKLQAKNQTEILLDYKILSKIY